VNASITDRGAPLPLSVVVISINAPELLARCLDALTAQARDVGAEILVVRDSDTPPLVGAGSPAHWIRPREGATVPQMRVAGLRAARGAVVGLIEDDVIVAADWCARAVASHATSDWVIGGVVDPGSYQRALDWAIYFCEYARFMRPFRSPGSMALSLAGNNVTYKGGAVQELLRASPDGFYDLFAHQKWERENRPMRVEETLVCRNVNSWQPRQALAVPFHHGRAYAGQRFPSGGTAGLARAVLALALPAVKVGRTLAQVLSRRRHVAQLMRATPWIVVFMTSWALGEAVGYARGPGNSASRWR
jgi:hypothetical protein